jgi:MFS family permease
MQLLVPDSLRGRAMSVFGLASTGALALGHVLGGALAQAAGARAATLGTSATLALFALWSAIAREPAIDALDWAPTSPHGVVAAVWEALTASSHRAQQLDAGRRGSAEPLEE